MRGLQQRQHAANPEVATVRDDNEAFEQVGRALRKRAVGEGADRGEMIDREWVFIHQQGHRSAREQVSPMHGAEFQHELGTFDQADRRARRVDHRNRHHVGIGLEHLIQRRARGLGGRRCDG